MSKINSIITFKVLYSIIKPYNSFFCDKSSYCTAGFQIERSILRWAKSRQNFKIYSPNDFYVRCNNVTQTQTVSGTEVFQTQAECKYKFVHTELVI